jgi:protein involved in plasmid replication-relaxation
MSATPDRAQLRTGAKPDSLRSTRAGAIWTALPARDQQLLLWLLAGDILTAQLAALLVYGQLRVAQRRLSRLVELGLLRGFWSATAQRPRGRYAYVLTRPTRLDVERLLWPEGRPDRPQENPASAAVHQLATHDLFAAFLRRGDALLREGIFAWVPERACGQLFDGFLRPDALAGIRVADRAIAMFIERDLGTERGEVLAEKIRRYRAVFARAVDITIHVGFVVESDRRAHTVHRLVTARDMPDGGVRFLTAVVARVSADPMGVRWTDGGGSWPTRDLVTASAPVDWPILIPGCLSDPDALSALDDRGSSMLPSLRPYVRGP